MAILNHPGETPVQTVIKNNRLRLGLSQEALAQRVGCDRSTIAAYESGKIVPSLPMAQKLAKEFGITLDALTADSPPRAPIRGRPRKAVAS
jgi:transcriptional regulator with XRE-family HTH domain